jgi:hypothetical protein
MKKLLLFIIITLLLTAPAYSADSGDEKIRDTIKSIQDAAGENGEDEDEYNSDGTSNPVADFFVQLIIEMIKLSFTQRFYTYPYADNAAMAWNTATWLEEGIDKIACGSFSSEAAYNFDGTGSNINRADFYITGVYFGIFNQQLFSDSLSFSALALNGGLSIFFPNFILTGFLGSYFTDFLDSSYLSYGFLSRIFFPGNVHLEVFNNNSEIGSLNIRHWIFSLRYAVNRYSIGASWHVSSFGSIRYTGPGAQLSVWF